MCHCRWQWVWRFYLGQSEVCHLALGRKMGLAEEPVSIKIEMGFLSKLPDTRHFRSYKTWFWINLEQGLISKWEWWFPRGISIDSILWVRISHIVMPFVVCLIRSTLSYDWGYAKVVDMAMCLVIHSWIGGSGNVGVLLETLSFPFMRGRNALHGYIVYKWPNRLVF